MMDEVAAREPEVAPAVEEVSVPPGGRDKPGSLARAFPPIHLNSDILILIGMVLVSLAMRLIGLGDRPLHHDESLHATYSWYLMGRTNPEYHYDPMMHGPLQFHMIAFFYSIFGSSPFSARLWSVTCGTALVAVPWLLRRQLGRWPTFALMAMLSLSPTTLYYSRFAREDMQFALFTLLMVVTLVRFIADRADGNLYHYRWLYLLGVSTGMAYAAKESIYLNVVMLGAFLMGAVALELLRGYELALPVPGVLLILAGIATGHLGISVLGAIALVAIIGYYIWTSPLTGPVTQAVRDTPLGAWLLAAGALLAIFVLLYWPIGDPASWAFIPGSNVVHTTLDIPGQGSKPFNYSTDGLTGGLLYWQAQQPVMRGGQPWYYYLFLIPLYEWLIVLFGIIGGIYVALKRRTVFTMLILWWTVASIGIYGWTSEKMPWNALHQVVPLAVLAAIGLGAAVTAKVPWRRYLAIALAAITALFTVHNALTLAYINGADPVEYMVQVQTTPDVTKVFSEMQRIQSHLNGPLHLQVDDAEGEEWPWVFYLRDGTKFWIDGYPTTASGFGTPTQPVLLVTDDNYPALSTALASSYVAFHEHLRWWPTETYKTYAERIDPTTGKLLSRVDRAKYFLGDVVSPATWWNVLQWEVTRRPITPGAWANFANSTNFWFLVRKDYIPDLTPDLQAQAQQQIANAAKNDPFLRLQRPLQPSVTYAAAATSFTSVGPVAEDATGDVFVADETARQIVEIGPTGTVLRRWGSPGTGPGQFNGQLTPSIGGLAVAPNGDIYAADTWNGRIQEFSPTGVYVRSWGQQNLASANLKPDDFYGPRGVAVGPDGAVYVADTGHKRIQVFTADGQFLRSIGQAGSAPGQLNEPSSVAVTPSGQVVVADYWNSRIQVFNQQGGFVRAFAVTAWQAGSYDEPQIAVDGQGRVLVPDPAGGNVFVYSSSGSPLYAWGNGASSTIQFTKVLFVASGTGGAVAVGDAGANTVMRFTVP